MQMIRPRQVKGTNSTVSVELEGKTIVTNTTVEYKKRGVAEGFLHPVIKELMRASVAKGYATRNGTPDFTALEKKVGVSRRMLYYSGKGSNISLKAVEQWGDLLGYEITLRKLPDL